MYVQNHVEQPTAANTRPTAHAFSRATIVGALAILTVSIGGTPAQAEASDDYVACLIGRASVSLHGQVRKDSSSALSEAYKHCEEPQGVSENELEGISDYVNMQVEAMVPQSDHGGDEARANTTVPQMWVTSDRLNRRTCPDERCGIVGVYMFREAANVIEERGGFVRVTPYYDAACTINGSSYVEKGNAACSPANGIANGKFAEWVSKSFLSAARPDDPAKRATALEQLISGSDDFRTYRAVFASAAQKLIASGECTEADFIEQGGWMKSTNDPNAPVYFTYCGGMTLANRIYLNAATEKITP